MEAVKVKAIAEHSWAMLGIAEPNVWTWFNGGFSEPRTPSFTPGREPHATTMIPPTNRWLPYRAFYSKSCDAMWNSENTTEGLGIGVLQQACSPVLNRERAKSSGKKSVSSHGAMDHP